MLCYFFVRRFLWHILRGQQVGTAQAIGEWMAIDMSDIGWSKRIGPSGESEILYEMALEDALHLGLVARR